jgi:hypothetical protein
MMKATVWTIIFLSCASVVWAYVATASTDPNVPPSQVGLFTLVGIVFTLGGVWKITEAFGMHDGQGIRGGYRHGRH